MTAPVTEGEILAGKYRVERILGEGGMGVVVAAMHVQLEQRVALKFLLPTALANPEAVARFLREARASVKLKGEHVAKVSDVGTLENGSPYMVMEYLEGMDLSDLLRSRGRLALEEAIDFLLQAGEGIAEAHTAGIVHRDLKPANLFISKRPDGTPLIKVLDFGISKMSGGLDGGMTKTTAVMGSPYYMSPEQMRSSRSVDARSDLWAMGIILYELLTGSVAFNADTMPELCANVLTNPTPRIRSVAPELPEAIEAIINRLLQKDPALRYQSAAELARDLAPFAPERSRTNIERIVRMQGGGEMTDLPPPRAPMSSYADGPRVNSPHAETAVNWGGTTAPRSGRGKAMAVVGVAVLGAGALAAVFLVARGGKSDSSAAAPTTSPAPSASAVAAPDATHPADPAQPPVVVAPASASASAAPPKVGKAIAGKGNAPPPITPPPDKKPPPPPKNDDPFGNSRH